LIHGVESTELAGDRFLEVMAPYVEAASRLMRECLDAHEEEQAEMAALVDAYAMHGAFGGSARADSDEVPLQPFALFVSHLARWRDRFEGRHARSGRALPSDVVDAVAKRKREVEAKINGTTLRTASFSPPIGGALRLNAGVAGASPERRPARRSDGTRVAGLGPR
jgi:hypothetical protein